MNIDLRLMTAGEFKAFMERAVPDYAKSKEEGEGMTPEAAMELSQRSFAELLTDGMETHDNYLYSFVTNDQSIGNVWLAKRGDGCFIYELYLAEDFRGKGLGKKLMALIDQQAKSLGFETIRLHVFGFNKVAIRLYESAGYITTNVHMMKKL